MKLLLKINLTIILGVCAMSISAVENDRKVFAHYMTCFSSQPDFYKREIQLAQHYGIDGFALNCGEWLKPAKDGKGEPTKTRYVINSERIFEQAKELDSGFKLFMSPDFACKSIREWAMLNVTDMYTRFEKHPNLFHFRGKPFYSGYAGSPAQYAPPINKLRSEGHDFWLVPKGSTPGYKMAYSMESILGLFRNNSPLDGQFNFACDGSVRNIVSNNSFGRRGTLLDDKIYMAGVCPAYNSPNLRDFRGVAGYGEQWQGLINDGADLVEIVTWNDYNEDSNLNPYRWGFGNNATEKAYYNRDESYLDVTSYYIPYFKDGIAPEIIQDRLFFSYRTRSKHQVKVWNDQTGKWVDVRFDKWPYDQLHDDVRDCIYVTGFLTADAELTVNIGGESKKFKLQKGISSCELPMQPGVPQFILKRNGKKIINVFGRKSIIDKITKENSIKGYHLAYRTWTSGAVAGDPIVTLDAKDTKIEKGKSLELPVPKMETATYNFQVTYSNPTEMETRLTMYSDGASGAESNQPFYFPLFLPPTGNEFRTVSFLWTQWDNTSKFKVTFDSTDDAKLIKQGYQDIGLAIIRKIELLKVLPYQPRKSTMTLPELVEIPGGSFTMGSNNSEPDEAPEHKVTVSDFAIGKYEITNEEFEKFRPEHKKHRDGYSWRDKEPVIYVSWKDAASYCNWLSKQNGLSQVYDEKTWQADMKADGFRLPTEAEWEYVATGRGENRTYPWGNETPTPDRGNYMLDKALANNPVLTSTFKSGVIVGGTYPKGASRDGVMDLAGNVCEWCTDYFNPYTPDAKTDPCDQQQSNHRVIRGGSWGYYNYSQRSKDREFNNDGYPGYIYIGLRIAISEAGYKKILKK